MFLFSHRKERTKDIPDYTKYDEELVGSKGFYPRRGFKEYKPAPNKSIE